VRGEKLEDWRKEIQALKKAVTLWNAVTAGRKEDLADLRAKLDLPLVPLAARRRLHLDRADPAMAALGMIQRTTDDHLQEHVFPRFIFSAMARACEFLSSRRICWGVVAAVRSVGGRLEELCKMFAVRHLVRKVARSQYGQTRRCALLQAHVAASITTGAESSRRSECAPPADLPRRSRVN